MDRQYLQQDELDKISNKLIETSVLSESEIDEIAASPFLYSGVKARINSANEPSRAFGYGRRFALGFGSALVVIGIAMAGLFMLRSENPVTAARFVPQEQPAQEVRDVSPWLGDKVSVPGVVMQHNSARFQKASYRKPEKRSIATPRPVPEHQPALDFYPLTFAGDPNETMNGGRVLRVEMSRSSLFAMGFNVPIENGAEVVKADLLVGPDGVARAIRLPN